MGLLLHEYDIYINHIKGKENVFADVFLGWSEACSLHNLWIH